MVRDDIMCLFPLALAFFGGGFVVLVFFAVFVVFGRKCRNRMMCKASDKNSEHSCHINWSSGDKGKVTGLDFVCV